MTQTNATTNCAACVICPWQSHKPPCFASQDRTWRDMATPGIFLLCRPILLPAEGATHTRCTSSMLLDREAAVGRWATAPAIGPYCASRASRRGCSAFSSAFCASSASLNSPVMQMHMRCGTVVSQAMLALSTYSSYCRMSLAVVRHNNKLE